MSGRADDGRIRIAFLIDDFRRGGGTENQLHLLLEHLDRDRFAAQVINLRPKHEEIVVPGVPVTYLGVERLKSLGTLGAAWRLLRLLRRTRVQILQVYFLDSRLLGTLVGRLAGVRRLVYCRRDLGWWHTPALLRLVRVLARLSDRCLVNARAVRDMVVACERFAADRITVVYNGVVVGGAPPADRDLRRDLDIPADAPLVGVISNLRPVKRLDRFLEVAARAGDPHAHYLIVGRGDLLDDLRAQAQRLGIADRVRFHHTIDGIPEVLAALDVGLLTSESEGLSNALIEYAFTGVPAVAFDVGGNAEVVTDGETGYVVAPGDVAAMAARLDALLADPDLRARLGAAAAARAESTFSVQAMVRATEAFYEEMLA